MITVTVEREDHKKRDVFHFKTKKLNWFMFLKDDVKSDPVRFNQWIQRMIQEIQLKDDSS